MLRLPPFRYHRPGTVKEAVALLARFGKDVLPIAGGTDLMPNMKHRLFTPAHVVSLNGIAAMRGIGTMKGAGPSSDNGRGPRGEDIFLRIGAIETLADVSMHPLVRRHCAGLAQAAGLVAGPQLRNMGTIGGVFFMLGVGLLYQATGTLNLRDIAARLEPSLDDRGTVLALALLVVGISIKLAVFPLHHWLPNAYSFAPPKVSAFLAATATKVSFYLLAMVLFTIFGAPFVFEELRLQAVLLPLSILAMFLASGAAIFQTDLRRLLAYSSVAQIGYMTLGLSTANATGLAGGLVHLFNHAVMKGGLFLVVACLLYRVGSVHIDALAGIGRRMPLTSAALVIGGLSLIGVPGTVGFVSKWYLVSGVLERGWTAAAVLILLSSLLALVYVGKVVEVVYFRKPAETQPIDHVREAPLGMLAPAWVLAAAAVFFGLTTDWTYGVAREAAELLLAGGI